METTKATVIQKAPIVQSSVEDILLPQITLSKEEIEAGRVPPIRVIDPALLARVYTLSYRYTTTGVLTKAFWFDGPLAAAITRGRQHCEIVDSRFVCVRPLIVDLDIQESDKRKDPSWAGDRKFD